MRDFIHLFVNGNPVQVAGDKALLTLSDFLRHELGLVGTKIVCNEGDCGACSVLVGQRVDGSDEFEYRSADSCILFMHQLDQTHVVSVEGLGEPADLSPIQQAMVDCHGSQCGYCTPGFVVAMHGLFEENSSDSPNNGQAAPLDDDQRLSSECLRLGLSGNLCRCTGYLQIIDAGLSVSQSQVPALNDVYPPSPMMEAFDAINEAEIEIRSEHVTVFVPTQLSEVADLKARFPTARIVSGATDVGVQHNHGRSPSSVVICLSRVAELAEIVADYDSLTIGSATTWTQILSYTDTWFPEFSKVLLRFGSPQIRNFGTIGGNLANASPIADSIPFLYVIDARLKLRSTSGIREVPINDFYQGYKQLELREDELIESICCPRLAANQRLKLYKISKRRDMDISTFTAALLFDLDGDTITGARIALGGVGPTVLRTPKAESSLVGQSLTLDTMTQAGEIAASEITPICDVRGSITYRNQLAENVFVKCFYDLTGSNDRSDNPGAIQA